MRMLKDSVLEGERILLVVANLGAFNYESGFPWRDFGSEVRRKLLLIRHEMVLFWGLRFATAVER